VGKDGERCRWYDDPQYVALHWNDWIKAACRMGKAIWVDRKMRYDLVSDQEDFQIHFDLN
jgi:hypothetical protein